MLVATDIWEHIPALQAIEELPKTLKETRMSKGFSVSELARSFAVGFEITHGSACQLLGKMENGTYFRRNGVPLENYSRLECYAELITMEDEPAKTERINDLLYAIKVHHYNLPKEP